MFISTEQLLLKIKLQVQITFNIYSAVSVKQIMHTKLIHLSSNNTWTKLITFGMNFVLRIVKLVSVRGVFTIHQIVRC